MPEPITIIIGSLIFAAMAAAFWHEIRQTVADWLRNLGLANSALMDAWIEFEFVRGKVVSKIFGKTKQLGKQKISERKYKLDEIQDPDVVRELEERGYIKKNIKKLVN